MSLDHATVRRIAKLARLHLDDADVPRVQAELNGILGWIAQLNEVDVSGVEAMTGSESAALRLREDAITDGGMQEKVLSNAPDRAGPFYAVPKVVE